MARVVGVVLLGVVAMALGGEAAGPIVTTRYGKVEGVVRGEEGVDVFWGIPFASPPLKLLRLAPPLPPRPWVHVMKADKIPNACPQVHTTKEKWVGDEDCLYLSVFRPSDVRPDEKLPVMV
eukprot:Sspe_Gene.52750::Locus_29206_Transcript_1_1_Confidence_1.000_Length_430::g.52750::m.52750